MYIDRYKTEDGYDDIILVSDAEYLTGLYFENSKDALKFKNNYEYKDLDIFRDTKK